MKIACSVRRAAENAFLTKVKWPFFTRNVLHTAFISDIFSWNFLHLCQFLPNVVDRNTNSDFKFTREFTSVASTNKVIGTEIHFYYFQVRRAKYTNSLRRSLSQKLIWYQIHTDHKPVNSRIISECSFHKNKMAFYLTFSFAVSHREKHQFNCRLAY